MTREEIVLTLCGMIVIPGLPEPIFREPRLAGADWNPKALIEHPGFDQFVALISRDHITHTAETVRAAWSWFQAGWHADTTNNPLIATIVDIRKDPVPDVVTQVRDQATLVHLSLSSLNVDVAIMVCIEAAIQIIRTRSACNARQAAESLMTFVETVVKTERKEQAR
jgi:hypothetical protein